MAKGIEAAAMEAAIEKRIDEAINRLESRGEAVDADTVKAEVLLSNDEREYLGVQGIETRRAVARAWGREN
jgi:hypothetical protein